MFKKSLGNDSDAITREDRLKAAEDLGQRVGIVAACRALKVSRSTLYRRREPNRTTQLSSVASKSGSPCQKNGKIKA